MLKSCEKGAVEARGVVGRDSIQTFFRNLVGDSQPSDAISPIIFVARCDNLAKRPDVLAILSNTHVERHP
jgi:hypothetical protein